MNKLRMALWSLFIVMSMGCSPITVSYDFAKEADFSRLKTYDWMSISPTVKLPKMVEQQVKSAVNRQLEAKGIVRKTEQPDFLIVMRVDRHEIHDVVHWGYARGTGVGLQLGLPMNAVYTFVEGTITLDFVDPKTKLPAWRGTATAALDPNLVSENQENKIEKALVKMLAHFPPSQKE